MPNWTYNKITFTNNETLNAFLDKVDPGNINHDIHTFDFNWFVPEPKTKEEALRNCAAFVLNDGETGGMTHEKGKEWFNWYDWHFAYWGTKWNACDVIIDNNSISFSTAWCTPDPIFHKIADICRKLKLLDDIKIAFIYEVESCFLDCGYYDCYDNNIVTPESEKEAAEIHGSIEGVEYIFDYFTNRWFSPDWDGVFDDENGYSHYFNIWDPDEKAAVAMHNKFGKPFDDMLKNNLEAGYIDADFVAQVTAID